MDSDKTHRGGKGQEHHRYRDTIKLLAGFGLLVSLAFVVRLAVTHYGKWDNESGTNLAIVFLTSAYVCASIFQWVTMQDSLDQSRAAVQQAREASARQLRAYVGMEDGYISGEVDRPRPSAQILIRNFGSTPAVNLIHLGGITLSEFPQPSDPMTVDANKAKVIIKKVLHPGMQSTLKVSRAPLSEQEIERLRKGEHLYVYGSITYDDVFGRSWSTQYRMVLLEGFYLGGVGADKLIALAYAAEGNSIT